MTSSHQNTDFYYFLEIVGYSLDTLNALMPRHLLQCIVLLMLNFAFKTLVFCRSQKRSLKSPMEDWTQLAEGITRLPTQGV